MPLAIDRTTARYETNFDSGVEVVASLRIRQAPDPITEQVEPMDPRGAVIRMHRALLAAADELEQEAQAKGFRI